MQLDSETTATQLHAQLHLFALELHVYMPVMQGFSGYRSSMSGQPTRPTSGSKAHR